LEKAEFFGGLRIFYLTRQRRPKGSSVIGKLEKKFKIEKLSFFFKKCQQDGAKAY
jgi:hypothetical protein